MPKVTTTLEFSRDPLSDTTPTWINISSYLIEASWFRGKKKDLDEPQAGGATFRLKNTNRRFEPDYVAGAYYPDIDLLRRFRLTVSDGITTTQQGVYYATDYEIEYPSKKAYSEVVVTCVDGHELLSLDNLEELDPADATSYEDVINHDDPVFYYRLGEPTGTKLVAHLRSKRWRKRHPHGRRRFRTVETRAELGGVSGPSGAYKNTPTLGVPGLILGDADTAVLFTSAQSEYARVALDDSDLIDTNRLTVSAWIKFTTTGTSTDPTIIAGPYSTAGSGNVFLLYNDSLNDKLAFDLRFTDGTLGGVQSTTTPAVDTIYHVVGTWDGNSLRIYVDGDEEGVTGGAGKTLRQGDAGGFFYIGRSNAGDYFDGVIDEVAVYEAALSPERVLAHYTAGALRGFPQQMAGDRVAEIATSDLWAETKIQAGALDLQPQMKHGQSRVEEIEGATTSEQPHSQFFFDGSGDPVYLGWDYKATGSYSTTQATFGDSGSEVRYEDIALDYDAELFNEVTISHFAEAGLEAHHTVTDATSIAARKRRVYSQSLALSMHEDAEAVADAVLDEFKDPALRPLNMSVSGGTQATMTQILTRDIGDLIRVKRRGEGGTPIDRVTHILGWSKHVGPDKHLTCTYNLARGFSGSEGYWRLGVTGFSELDGGSGTAVLA